jgi:hypothetical protein
VACFIVRVFSQERNSTFHIIIHNSIHPHRAEAPEETMAAGDHSMNLLRMAFLAPALADFYLASLTLWNMSGVVDDSLVPRGQFAAVAFCWGIFLLLGMASRPVERAWILLPTALVIGLIGVAYANAYMAGAVEDGQMARVVVLVITFMWLCWRGWKMRE